MEIKNKKAYYNYTILNKYIAGIKLQGPEVKAIRNGKVDISAAYCIIINNEVFIRNIRIYNHTFHYNIVDEYRDRKLLLKKKEITKISKELGDNGKSMVPIKMFLDERGLIKMQIAIATGKKLHDKRNDIKKKDIMRDNDRKFK